VIVEIEGATSEPARRLHAVALSAASALVSLIVLLALVLPPLGVSGPRSASPAANPSATAFTITLARPDTRITMTQLFSRDGTALLACFVGSDASVSPLVFARPDTWGPLVSVGPEPSAGRSVPVPVAARRSGWLSVNCATSGVFAPREMFER